MFKIFFITFFISELIITLTVILKLYELNKCVNSCNDLVLFYRDKIRTCFGDIRLIIEDFNKNFTNVKQIIKKKREEYFYRVLKTSLIYLSILLLKGKYKKTVLAYQAIKEIYEGITEA